MSTFGIHVIWTTYMTWPPGDPRGHLSALFDFYGRLIDSGHKLNVPDRETLRRATTLAREAPKILTEYEVRVVAEKVGEIVHLAPGMPGAICGLRIEAASIEPTQRAFASGTAHTRYRQGSRQSEESKAHNERRDLPAAPYDWIVVRGIGPAAGLVAETHHGVSTNALGEAAGVPAANRA